MPITKPLVNQIHVRQEDRREKKAEDETGETNASRKLTKYGSS
jgi:hypothetical protein